LNDPLYLGLRQKRISNAEAKEFIEEFMEAVKRRWPRMLVQFEDFNTELAFDLLDIWRDKHTCFNDDVSLLSKVS
jgi:malate dehydrogenase (oxaloacetate-decarboxylating)(NADP+)